MSYYKVKLSSGSFIETASKIEDLVEHPELLSKIVSYKTNEDLIYSGSYTLGYDQVYYIHDSIFGNFRGEFDPEDYKRIENEEVPKGLDVELRA